MRNYFLLILNIYFSIAYSIAQEVTMEIDTSIASQYISQARDLESNGLYEEAINTIQLAKDIYVMHELWKKAIRCEVHKAIIADNFESPDLKVHHTNQALILANKYLTNEDLILASVYRQKAEALMWIGQLDSANYFIKQAMPIFENNGAWEDYAWTEVLLAVNYLNTYQLEYCVQRLNKVEEILKEHKLTKNVHDELQATLLDLRGVAYDFQGDYNEAIKNLNAALEINFRNSNLTVSDSGFISIQFTNLGAIYLTKGDYMRAEDNFLQAIYYNKNAMVNPNILYNIGHQYLKQKKYLQAIEYFEKSASLLNNQLITSSSVNPSNSKYFVESLNGLCSCFLALGKYQKALSYCQKAEISLNGNKKYITWALMGNIYIDKEQPEKAIYYLNMANIDLIENGVGFQDKVLIQARILHLLGEALVLNEDPQSALFYLQKSLVSNHRTFEDSLNVINNPSLSGIYEPIYFLETISTKAKAQTLIATDDSTLHSALSTYQLTIQWIDSLQASYALESTQIDWSADFKPIYEKAINTCYKLYENTKEIKYLNLAFSFSEKSRSSILLEQLKSKEGKYSAGIPDSLLQMGKDLNLDIAFYENKLEEAIEVKDSAKLKLHQNYLSQSRLNLAALEEKLEKDYPKFYQSKYASEQASIHQIQENLLAEKSALLEYFFGDSVAYVFVIDKESATMIRLEELSNIKLKFAEFMNHLKDIDAFKRNAKNAIATYNEFASALYSQLLENPLSQISTTIDHLIIIPDDKLNALSFEALTDDKNVDYTIDFAGLPFLIYKYKFQYSYSVQLLFENQKRRGSLSSNTDCLGFAPSYQPEQSIALSGDFEQLRNKTGNLKGTAIEISNISKFVDGQFYFGEMATESQFKEEADRFGLLHLAMHGTVDLENSNYNHLKFSDITNEDLEDNLLHQYEIGNMDLDAQMVVLSACETGLGRYEKGEGVFSLARSFMYAGVPSVVMSLWRVSDASTSQLMPQFYQNLMNNQSKVAALHDAKLNYLASSDLSMRHPFYWSAFVVIGDGKVLKTSNSYFFYWGIGGIILLILIGWITRKMTKLRISN